MLSLSLSCFEYFKKRMIRLNFLCDLDSRLCFYFSGFLNKPKVYNTDSLYHALSKRPLTVPLITVSNHDSCFDDPGLWGKVSKFYFTRVKPSHEWFPWIVLVFVEILVALCSNKHFSGTSPTTVVIWFKEYRSFLDEAIAMFVISFLQILELYKIKTCILVLRNCIEK